MSEQNTHTTDAIDTSLKGRQAQLLGRMVKREVGAEQDRTEHYLAQGKDAWHLLDLMTQEDKSRKQARDTIRLWFSEQGVKADLSAYEKAYALSTLCPDVSSLGVGVLKALLPVVHTKGSEPRLEEGVSVATVSALVEKAITPGTSPLTGRPTRWGAEDMRNAVNELLGEGEKVERKEWEKTVAYLNKVTDKTLLAALKNNPTLQERMAKLVAKLTKPASEAIADAA